MTLQKMGIIGDVHCQHKTLEIALEFLKSQNVQRILCTGDIADGDMAQTGDLKRCCELLQNANVAVVRGNHDRWFLNREFRDWEDATGSTPDSEAARAYLRCLPSTQIFETPAGKLLLCHGMGENDMQGIAPDDDSYALKWKDELLKIIEEREYFWAVAGHTHRRMARRFERLSAKPLWVLNAGTLRPEFSPCISVVDFKTRNIRFWNFENDGFHEAEIFSLIN